MNRIIAHNLGSSSVLIQEGLLVEGLKQSRMVIHDQVLSPGAKAQISVACIERGRWGSEDKGHVFGRAPISVIAAAREGALGEPSGSVRRMQHRVWSSVAQHHSKLENMTSTSLTEVVTTYKRSSHSLNMNSHLNYEAVAGQSGFVVAALGAPLLIEAFADQRFFEHQFKEIIESLFWDISEVARVTSSRRDVLQFLKGIEEMGVAQLSNGICLSTRSASFAKLGVSQTKSALHELVINHQHPIFV